jgi:hypothetical protein
VVVTRRIFINELGNNIHIEAMTLLTGGVRVLIQSDSSKQESYITNIEAEKLRDVLNDFYNKSR